MSDIVARAKQSCAVESSEKQAQNNTVNVLRSDTREI